MSGTASLRRYSSVDRTLRRARRRRIQTMSCYIAMVSRRGDTCKKVAVTNFSPALVTGQIAKEVNISGKELEKLFESLGEKVLKLQ